MTVSTRLIVAMVSLVLLTLAAVALLTPAALAPSSLVAAAVAIACAVAMAVLFGRALAHPSADVAGSTASPGQHAAQLRQGVTEPPRQSERERLYAAAVEHSEDAIVTKTLDGVVTAWNPAAERLFGYTAQEMIGQNIAIVIPEERRDEEREILAKLARGETIEPFETERLARDGQRIDMSISVSPVKSTSGEIIGAAKIARDIRERRKAQADLVREMEERRQIFETSLDLILVTDHEGFLLNVSPSAKDILGYAPDEMIGHNAIDFIHPGDLPNTYNEMMMPRSGHPIRNFECRYLHRDGHPVTLTWSGIWSEPLQKHFFSGCNMTEQKHAERELRDSERMARGIVDTALDAFVQMDDTGVVTEWNPQAETVFGWPRALVLGQRLADLIIPERDRARLNEARAHFLRTGESSMLGRRIEVEGLRRDGKEINIELSITALRRRGSYVFNAFMRDITDKIAADEHLRQAQKMETIGQLTGGIAHDFNNILTVITGTIEILEEGVAGDPELAAIARMIDEAALRGAELTQHLLAFARRQPLQPRITDVNTLIVDAAKLLRPTLGEHIEIESAFADDAWPALVDPSQLTAALINLAVNARDAMPNGGKLVLETGNVQLDDSYARKYDEVVPGSYVMVAVSDTGHGIPAAIRDKVFEPFFTTKGTGKGTGLGLSMVYGFVKQSNGHIEIYSEEGYGTAIKLYLPRAGGQPEPAAVQAATALEGGTETILVVEDDPMVRTYVATQLSGLGYTTLVAGDATEALEYIDGVKNFDLLFTDVIMPGAMNGRELADEAVRRRPALKVLFTSGYTEDAIVHHGRLDPGVLLLAKPYRKSDLARMVRVALAGSDKAGLGTHEAPLPSTDAAE
jgi:PAS domain S-box-containing protein